MKNLTSLFMVLDIETSVQYIDVDGKKEPFTTWLSYGVIKVYNLNAETKDICKFRTWEELNTYLHWISCKFSFYKIICYCHNLSFEFDFLIKNISRSETILTNSTHNVISSILKEFDNIEFRCSYQLTGYSLRKLGDIIGIKKLDSEYRTIFPCDEITEQEWEYCERDCDIVGVYISQILKEYKKLFSIPYTKTGRVRKFLKENYKKYEKNPEWDLLPDEKCYSAMVKTFNGAITISNPLFTNITLKNVHSYDETSAYPYVGFKEEFPYTIECEENFNKNSINNYKFWIAKIRYTNIESKFNWQWLSISKMEAFDEDSCEFFNGKLIKGNWIERYITNIDFKTIEMSYRYDDYEILEFYKCEKFGKMPKCYIETMLMCANRKHELKQKSKKFPDDIDIQRDYMLSKNDFNSIGYGVHVQKLTTPNYQIDENYQWHDVTTKYVQTSKHIRRNFLFGIYITAYSRYNLVLGIVENCPDTFVYADTDSIKFIGENIFKNTNEMLKEPYDKIDSIKDLGVFDYETTYEEFKVLGAKKYAYKNGDKITLTVAGLPKGNIEKLNSLDDFKCGKVFKDCKLGKKYLFDSNSFEIDDEWNIVKFQTNDEIQNFLESNDIVSNGGVALYPTSYKLDMTNSDKFYTQNIQKNLKTWIETYKIKTGIDLTNFIGEVEK